MPAARSRQPRPCLRIGSHNVQSIISPARAKLALELWDHLAWDVVLLQETWLSVHDVAKISRFVERKWQAHWCHRPGRGAGVAILIRKSLLSSSFFVTGPPTRLPGGRLIALPVSWGGHSFQLASIYFPVGDRPAQRSFISEKLGPNAPRGSGALVWGGDFNFVENAMLDRCRTAATSPRSGEASVAAAWQAAFPSLTDVYRAQHPTARSFTYFSASSAARLDRLYTTPNLLPFMSSCSAATSPLSPHRPVTLVLLPKHPILLSRPPPPKARLQFARDPALRQAFLAWGEAEASHAPEDEYALLLWWPSFLSAVVHNTRVLSADLRAASQAQVDTARQNVSSCYERVEGDEGLAALPDLAVAARQLSAAQAAQRAADQHMARLKWLHAREYPHPELTTMVHPPKADKAIPALRVADGRLSSDPRVCARTVITHWAHVCSSPPTSAAAQQAVLASMADSPKLPPEQAAELGAATVSTDEVKRALRKSPPGSAPGLDGVSVDLYRAFKTFFLPLLARLFSAIGTTGQLPPRFHDGLISVIFKSGDRAAPGNYRPITLLNSAYRLLARVLASRLGALLPTLISPEQTAFVPGRRIGENVLLLQLLPHWLSNRSRAALVVFCDFLKAYDTLDREFLFSIMAHLGLGESFLRWVRLLLTHTRACALVNGCTSNFAFFTAGVRQGCPLAPLLYLFVTEALLRFLRSRGFGIPLGPARLVSSLYADDNETFLDHPDQVPHFLHAMTVFAEASGQRLNPTKTVLLPIGAPFPAPLPAEIAGLRVVSSAPALGFVFHHGTDPPSTAWDARLDSVRKGFSRLARLGLTAFGRGMASSSYCVSTLLYHAEYLGPPPAAHLDALATWSAALVDRGRPPNATEPSFPGVARPLLLGQPRCGGFGVLPWQFHISARLAAWGVRLATGSGATPWERVAADLLRDAHPSLSPFSLLGWVPSPNLLSALAAPLRRMLEALRALPPLEDVAGDPLPDGAWTAAAPLWGNPFLPGLPAPTSTWVSSTSISTVADLARAHHAAFTTHPGYWPLVRPCVFGHAPFVHNITLSDAKLALDALKPHIPPPWWEAVPLVGPLLPFGEAALAALLPRLGWSPPDSPVVTLGSFSVRHGTQLHLICTPIPGLGGSVHAARQVVFSSYCALALQRPASDPAVAAAVPPLIALLERLWRLRWSNRHKETFWRLIYNGLPTAARMHKPTPCACGHPSPCRSHHFWDCPIAKALLADISTQLPGAPPQSQAVLWLALPPATCHPEVWDVVCLAAVAALDSARRRMVLQLHNGFSIPGAPEWTEPLSTHAIAHFWRLLADFCGAEAAPPAWREHLSGSHPFICYSPTNSSFCVSRRLAAA